MVVAKIRYEEGSYEGEINDKKVPTGTGTFEYRYEEGSYEGEINDKKVPTSTGTFEYRY